MDKEYKGRSERDEHRYQGCSGVDLGQREPYYQQTRRTRKKKKNSDL